MCITIKHFRCPSEARSTAQLEAFKRTWVPTPKWTGCMCLKTLWRRIWAWNGQNIRHKSSRTTWLQSSFMHRCLIDQTVTTNRSFGVELYCSILGSFQHSLDGCRQRYVELYFARVFQAGVLHLNLGHATWKITFVCLLFRELSLERWEARQCPIKWTPLTSKIQSVNRVFPVEL